MNGLPSPHPGAPGDDGAEPEGLRLVGVEGIRSDEPGMGGPSEAVDGSDAESSFCGYVVVPLDPGLQMAPIDVEATRQEKAMAELLEKIRNYGANNAVNGTGPGVRQAWADVKNELTNWRLK